MICSNCNNIVPDNSDFCPNCGLQLVTNPTTHISPSVCPNCGSREYFKNGKCVSCGRKNSKAKKNNGLKVVILILVLFLVSGMFTTGMGVALSEDIDHYKAEAEKYEKKYKTASEDYEEILISYDDLKNRGGEFFAKNVVIVMYYNKKYHEYGCSEIDYSKGYDIFSRDFAEYCDYMPCSKCCD